MKEKQAQWRNEAQSSTPSSDNPDVSNKRATKRSAIRQRCADDPAWCNLWQQRRKEIRVLRKQCQTNPDRCEELKQKIEEHKAQWRKEAQQNRTERQVQ